MTQRPLARRVLEVGLSAVLSGLLAVAAARAVAAIAGPWDVAVGLLGAALGLLLTDLLSGVIHWLCDTYGDEHTPWIGPTAIAANRDHHRRPQEILGLPFLELNFSGFAVAVAVLAVALPLSVPPPGSAASVPGQACLFSLGLCLALSNSFHRWAHQARPSALAVALQRAGIALDPRDHARHHASSHRAYCLSSGRLNRLLDRVEAFHRAERLLARLGIEPSDGAPSRRSRVARGV
ncbi:MAG: fatty acid desaturase CarF family protein [Myxococcota bacterium]